MLQLRVQPGRVVRSSVVRLRIDLPVGFMNRNPIRAFPVGSAQTEGIVVSDGFEDGRLEVHFSLLTGDERVSFDEISAEEYLECDPWPRTRPPA